VSAAAVRLEVSRRLSPEEVDAVGLLVERVTETDGVRPLSEHVSLHLRYGGDSDVVHVTAWGDPDDAEIVPHPSTGSMLIGYAHLDITDPIEGSSAEICVDPAVRGRGIGSAIVHRLRHETPDGRLRLWAHGEHSASAALATRLGFTRTRVLWQMRRSLFAPLPAPKVKDDITIRTFIPGQDDADWLAVNAEAFAGHPDQGSWTLDDLHARMNEPWFDAAGFFVATRAAGDGTEEMVGFHWTKVHGGLFTHEHEDTGLHAHSGHGHDPIGEIYVIGVLPAYAGHGLGRALALIGLRHLRSLTLPEAMLYVEADNVGARSLYESLDFRHWDTDVMFSAPEPEFDTT